MAKRRYDPDASREDILNAAEQLFATYGYGDVSTSRIAKQAGVSQSQIHYHFKTKRGLWSAVFRHRFTEYFEAQSETLRTKEVEGIERVDLSIRAYFNFFRKNPQFVKLLSRAQLDGIGEKKDEPMPSDLMREGTAVIEQAQRDGLLRDDVKPQFILIGFLSMVAYWFQCREEHLKDSGLTGEPDSYDDSYLEFILKIYLKGISP